MKTIQIFQNQKEVKQCYHTSIPIILHNIYLFIQFYDGAGIWGTERYWSCFAFEFLIVARGYEFFSWILLYYELSHTSCMVNKSSTEL